MRIQEFSYYKEKEKITKKYKVLHIKDMDTYIEGISLGDLNEEQQQSLIKIYEDFEKQLEPYMKQYRRFRKDMIVKE